MEQKEPIIDKSKLDEFLKKKVDVEIMAKAVSDVLGYPAKHFVLLVEENDGIRMVSRGHKFKQFDMLCSAVKDYANDAPGLLFTLLSSLK